MNSIAESFESNGYAVLANVLPAVEISRLSRDLEEVPVRKAGTRNLLSLDWCVQLAQSLKQNPLIATLLPKSPVAVQCTYFAKSATRNWSVTPHRDYSIPVKSRFSVHGWSAWSTKEGVNYVRPPERVLGELVAVRLHLEANTERNGLLQVVPGSHKVYEASGRRIDCLVPKGGALIMRPLLLHASPKLTKGRRRVLHFLYGPAILPDGAEWASAV